MSEIHATSASLRFRGDDLDPDEVTALLGARPSVGVRRGGVWTTSLGATKIAHTGWWRLHVERRIPGDLDGQIEELLAPLTDDLQVWTALSARFQGDVFCGVFLNEWNEGISLKAETLMRLGARRLLIDFDIYAPAQQDPEA